MTSAPAPIGSRRDLALVLPVAVVSTLLIGSLLAMGASALYVPDRLVAYPSDPDHPAEDPWDVPLDELDQDYPIVARALRDPGTFITIEEEDRAVLEAFFLRLNEAGHDAVRVDGQVFLLTVITPDGPQDDQYVITGSEGGPSPPVVETDGGPPGHESSEAPTIGLILSLLASVGTLLWVRRM